jgi:hypothetical protein
VKAGAAGDGGARGERAEQRRNEAVDVEERHDVEAPVDGGEFEGLGHVAGRGTQHAVGQRHELGARRRSGGVQEECDAVGIGRSPVRGTRASAGEAEDTGGSRTSTFSSRTLEPRSAATARAGESSVAPITRRVRPEIVEIERELPVPGTPG